MELGVDGWMLARGLYAIGINGARGFVVGKGLREVVEWVYRKDGGPRLLEKNLRDMQDLLRRSEVGEEVEGERQRQREGSPSMSKGACISLKRILERMESDAKGLSGRLRAFHRFFEADARICSIVVRL